MFLTKTASAGSGKSIQVEDAGYFMDGWATIEGDLIQLEGQTQTARIINVNYDSNVITIDQALPAWIAGAGVSLPYKSAAPDIGAHEYEGITTSIRELTTESSETALLTNTPNPFNPVTTIRFMLKSAASKSRSLRWYSGMSP